MRNWNIFGAWMNHGHTHIYKTHHSPYLGEATTFPLIMFSMINHKGYTQMSFCPEIGTLDTLEACNFFCRPLIEVIFKAKL